MEAATAGNVSREPFRTRRGGSLWLVQFFQDGVSDLVDAEGSHEHRGDNEANQRRGARAEFFVAICKMEIKRRAREEREHQPLCDRAPKNKRHRVSEDEKNTGEGNRKNHAADFHPAHAVLRVAIFIDAKNAERIREHARVRRRRAEDRRVKNHDGAAKK